MPETSDREFQDAPAFSPKLELLSNCAETANGVINRRISRFRFFMFLSSSGRKVSVFIPIGLDFLSQKRRHRVKSC